MDLETISSGNLNKELAYLLGVYLTDGSISLHKDGAKSFSLKTIDREFAEWTLQCVKKNIPTCIATVYEYQPPDREWKEGGKVSKVQKQYCLHIGFAKLASFFWEQTGKKHHIPFCIWEASSVIKRWFIAGVLDGDGWISKTKRDYNDHAYQYRIGVCGADGWIYEFKELLEKMGIKTLGLERMKKFRKTVLVAFGINVKSFISNNLFFTVNRKQNRVLLLRNVQRLNVTNPTGLR